MLARIRNGLTRGLSTVKCQGSNKKRRVLEVLVSEGFLRGYRVVNVTDDITDLEIDLKYFEGQPAIKELKRVSKPGRRAYYSAQDLPLCAMASASPSCRPTKAYFRMRKRAS